MDTKKYYLVVLYQNVMHLLKRAITICGQYMFYNWLLHRMYFKRSKFSIFLNCTQYQTPGLWQRSVPELNNLSNILFSWLFNSVNVESKIIIIFFFLLDGHHWFELAVTYPNTMDLKDSLYHHQAYPNLNCGSLLWYNMTVMFIY